MRQIVSTLRLSNFSECSCSCSMINVNNVLYLDGIPKLHPHQICWFDKILKYSYKRRFQKQQATQKYYRSYHQMRLRLNEKTLLDQFNKASIILVMAKMLSSIFKELHDNSLIPTLPYEASELISLVEISKI